MQKFRLLWRKGLWSLMSLSLIAIIVLGVGYFFLLSQLPNVETLKQVQLQVPLRIYTNDNQLMAEYGEKRRLPVTIDQVPKPLINAVLATEDSRFFDHPGVDVIGLGRATLQLLRTGNKTQGGSTITMQVARNFFLTRKKTYVRKLNEILLAIKIDQELSKEKILELYLNKIYFGNRAYGVAAAAKVYYGKSLQELTLPQMAMIAGLPKAPSRVNPLANPSAAIKRRNHVLERMLTLEMIDQTTFDTASKTPITATYHGRKIEVYAPYVTELIRQALVARFGKEAYTKGYQVYTTIDTAKQLAANQALRRGLIGYDRRHGYRGPLKVAANKKFTDIPTLSQLPPAQVIAVDYRTVTALLKNEQTIQIDWSGLQWARPQYRSGLLGKAPQQASDILKVGDIIRVERLENNSWRLAQLPEIEGAIISLNPQDGAIEALVGGFDYNHSKFNRVTQAERQPGSSFKPFVYSAALAKGYSLATIVNDAPVVMNDPSQEALWRPENDNRKFYGPTRLRMGLIRSRNLVSIRLLESIGIPYAISFVEQFGFKAEDLPKTLSLALGSATTTPLQIAAGYAVFANGGYKVDPFLITHINDSLGQPILQAKPKLACSKCANNPVAQMLIPEEQRAMQILTPQVAYLMNLAMRDVIQNGTGRAAKVLQRQDLAGKTGTTNNQADAWFAGFNGDLVTVTWVGFDKPKSLREYAAKAALPIWIEFMGAALKGKPEKTMPEPPGLVTVRIDPRTGLLAHAAQTDSIFETFRKDQVPQRQAPTSYQSYGADDDTVATEEDEPLF